MRYFQIGPVGEVTYVLCSQRNGRFAVGHRNAVDHAACGPGRAMRADGLPGRMGAARDRRRRRAADRTLPARERSLRRRRRLEAADGRRGLATDRAAAGMLGAERIVGMPSHTDPHAGQRLVERGPAPLDARLTLILIHGRGATAESILTLADELPLNDLAYLAPQAARQTWYPNSFLAPIPQNEPGISSGIGVIATLVERLAAEGVGAGGGGARRPPRFLAGRFLGAGVGGAAPPPVRRCVRPERRVDRPARHAPRLSGFVRRRAGVPWLQ